MATARNHKVSKGENLTGIAKKWKHPKWQEIWNDSANAAVKKKRKDPDKIEAGDLLHIPYTQAERKAFEATKLMFLSMVDVERRLAATLNSRADANSKAATLAMARHKQINSDYDGEITMLNKAVKDTKSMKDGVDFVWTVTTAMRNLGKLAKLSRDASKASGKALEEINKKARKDAVDMMSGPVEGEAKKAGAKYLLDEKNDISTLGLIVGTIAEAQDKMTSPSFWFETIVQVSDGKGWSEAVTHDFEREAKNKIYLIDKEKIFLTKKLMLQAQEAEKNAGILRTQAKAALKRADDIRKEVDKLPNF